MTPAQTSMLLADGIYPNVPRDLYDASDRTNISKLKHMGRSAEHYQHREKKSDDDTAPKKVGRSVHIMTLEPHLVGSTIAVWDGGRRQGKDWEAFKLLHAGKELLTEEEYEESKAMAKKVRADPRAAIYLERGNSEVTLLWTAPVVAMLGDGSIDVGQAIKCRRRIDFDSPLAIAELKTARDGRKDKFSKQGFELGYFAAAAWSVDGYAHASGRGIVKPYKFLVVESTPPYVVSIYEPTQEEIQRGREDYQGWLNKLATCRARGIWPGYSDGEELIERPYWAQADGEIEDDFSDLTSGGEPLAATES